MSASAAIESVSSRLESAIGTVRSVYQPIVELASRDVAAYEALARGPEGSELESPVALFEAAEEAGRLVELDWACRAAAVSGAAEAGLGRDVPLFLNIEPRALDTPCPPHLARHWDAARGRRIVVEITERDLAERPAELLRSVRRARRHGWGVAVDDLGADPRSLALMPLLQPDVIKLDRQLVQGPLTARTASVVNAVVSQMERTGACVLAEGIETEGHARALALGATLGQGWLFGRPGALPADPAPRPRAIPFTSVVPELAGSTPHSVVSQWQRPGQASKRLLIELSKHLEQQALALADTAIVLSTFQYAHEFTPGTARRYERLARHAGLVGAVAIGLSAEPAPGVRGAALPEDHPLRAEWDVVVLGPHFAAALVAHDLSGGESSDHDRPFDYTLTYDRSLAIQAAISLVDVLEPLAAQPSTLA